jgi:hypothetical protein
LPTNGIVPEPILDELLDISFITAHLLVHQVEEQEKLSFIESSIGVSSQVHRARNRVIIMRESHISGCLGL